MQRAFLFAMTSVSASPSPAAVAAFLRGLDKRAQLFAAVQAGDAGRGARARAAVARVFAAEAGQWPLAQWPSQYWRLLLATPSLRQASPADASPMLPGIARLRPEPRAAVLLQVVAGLEDAAAASALGLSIPDYQAMIRDSLPRNELGQPDVDVWRAWRAAAQRELERAADPPPLLKRATAAPASPTATEPADPEAPPARGVRWLWLGVAACVLAFAAAFFIHPVGREALQQWFAAIKREALPAAAAPRARFDATDPALHPDREQLASPREAGFAEQAALLAWLLNASADPAAADAVRLPIATDGMPAMLPEGGTDSLASRMQRWDALPARVRGVRRGAWQAWRALDAGERVQLRALARRVGALSGEERQAMRDRFALQSSDERAGWWLGPRLGRDWPRVAALFGYVDAGERDAVLRLLRGASPAELDALARLAQGTPPEERAALRAELLAQPASQREAWLQARFQR